MPRIFKVGQHVRRTDNGVTGVITKIGPKYATMRQDDAGNDLRYKTETKRKAPVSYPIEYKYLIITQ